MFQNQFGIQSVLGSKKFIDRLGNTYEGIAPIEDSRQYERKSAMGVPVWDIVELEALIEEGTGKKFSGYEFPAEMTIEAVQAKKIVETDIVGQEGMVEELVSMDDWVLSFKGFLINYSDEAFPEADVIALKKSCQLKHSTIPVVSEYLNILGINFISIHNLRLPQLAGYSNVQPFEIQAKSKNPFIVTVADGVVL